MIRLAAFLLFSLTLTAATPVRADPLLALPVACTIGADCWVQNYVDTDPAEGPAADFTCGGLVYDDHRGTDIRLADYVAMEKGVAVLAAADGVVAALRDGMDDVNVREIGFDAIKDRMAGNSVVIDHGGGWVTQYAHMKKGSVAVAEGQQVKAGDRLGEIGLSGNTEFPHLHFEVRHDKRPVDPFTGSAADGHCGQAGNALWQPDVAVMLAYRPGDLIDFGFAAEKPAPDAARHGKYDAVAITADSPALVFWVDFFGLQEKDRLRLTVTGPAGEIAASDQEIPRAKAAYFAFAGKKRPEGGWPSGTYEAKVELERGGNVLVEKKVALEIP